MVVSSWTTIRFHNSSPDVSRSGVSAIRTCTLLNVVLQQGELI